jgi:hypothetical protein
MSLKQQLRKYQDGQQNAGWRIQMIPYDDKSKPMVIETNWFALAGAIGFIISFFLLFHNRGKDAKFLIEVAVGSWLFALFGIWLKAKTKRRSWEVTTAHCVDRELQQALTGRGNNWGWYWRFICEYEYHGEKHRVTPTVQWVNFTSEEAAMKFIEEKISPDGECKLHVNPKNPLQTELVGQRIKDKLLY